MSDVIPASDVQLDSTPAVEAPVTPMEGREPQSMAGMPIDASDVAIDPNDVQLDQSVISPDDVELDSDKYGTPGQMALTAAEGAAKGLAGPVATYLEKKLHEAGVPGISPEEQEARREANPWTHGLGEAAGFGAGMFTGASQASALAKAGSLATKAAGLGEAASVGSRLAAAAVGQAAEMGLYQAGDELSKYINNAPQSVGSVVSNVGLSGLLGGIGGPLFAGAGMATKSLAENVGLKDFVERLAYRKANIDPNDMVKHEADNIVNTFQRMNSEINGAEGIKAQALARLLPKELTPNIEKQAADILEKGALAGEQMVKSNVPERYIQKYQSELQNLEAQLQNAKPEQIFDALNDFKKTLQDYSKGNFGPFAIPSYHEAHDFLKFTKSLGFDVRTALENPKVWGEAADLQKELNKSWTKALPAFKDFEKKFMVKIGDVAEISSDKFNTYMNQAGKATSTTDKQKMLGNFIDAMDNHFKTVENLYKKAGVENPHGSVSMNSLKESLEKKSVGAKLADMWHDKLGADSLGTAAGATLGGTAGSLIGHGLGGAWLGKEVLGPVFSNLIKPMLERYPNVDVAAFAQAQAYLKAVMKGERNLENAVGSVFTGTGKTFPSNIMPSVADLDKLDKKTKEMNNDMQAMEKLPGKVGTYVPGHETFVAKTANDAVNFINSRRPESIPAMPLDPKLPVSAMQKAEFDKTLMIAQQPLSVFKDIQDGTLTPKDVSTLKALYPEYYDLMAKKVMEHIADHVQEETPMDYKTKMSLSVFLGQPLDSTMTPASILAAQPKPQGPPMQNMNAPMKGKQGKTAINKLPNSYKTTSQAAEGDRGSRD